MQMQMQKKRSEKNAHKVGLKLSCISQFMYVETDKKKKSSAIKIDKKKEDYKKIFHGKKFSRFYHNCCAHI